MSFKSFFCGLALALMTTAANAEATFTTDSQPLHRGDYVQVMLRSGAVYHLRLTGSDGASLIGASDALSVHLRNSDIVNVEREVPPPAQISTINASTATLGLLSLGVVSQGASQNFGAGQACNGSTSAC